MLALRSQGMVRSHDQVQVADDSARDHADEGHTDAQFLSLDELVVSSTGI
jgi:hypothetical protein